VESAILAALESASGITLFLAALGAGALTSLAPCSIVTVPLLVGSALGMTQELEKRARARMTWLIAFVFTLGVMISFSILAFLVAKMGLFFSIAPMWAYIAAGILALFLGFYSMGWIGQLDKTKAFAYLLKWRLFGVLLIGVIFGIVSTPCASAPLVAIIALASSFDEAQAYSLVLVFTLGHCLLLLLAGVCVGFVQSVASNPLIGWITKVMTQVFALGLIAAGGYFFYQAWLQGF